MTENLPAYNLTDEKPFVVMGKPAGPICNLDCRYCYYTKKNRYYDAGHDFMMSDTVLEKYVRDYIKASHGKVVQFVWHGGEPTVAGLDFFKKAVKYQKKYAAAGQSVWNNIQTNGILLDDEWCGFLADNKFDVGLSIDGTQWLHDEYRLDKNGQGTYEKVAESLKRLKRHGVMPDLLCTVTSSIAREPLAVYRNLRDLGTGWMQFIPVVNHDGAGGVSEHSVSGEQYGKFLCDIFDEWVLHDIGKTNVQIIAETSLMIKGIATNLCQLSQECGRVLVVEHDGGVYSCDHFVTPQNLLGNILQSDIGILVDSPKQKEFGRAKSEGLSSKCLSCKWLTRCYGGCPKNRFVSIGDDEPLQNYLCEGYKMFFEHTDIPLKKIAELQEKMYSAVQIMGVFKEHAKAVWSGVGRNDPCPCGSGKKAKNCCWDKKP